MLAISLWRHSRKKTAYAVKLIAIVCFIVSYKLFEGGALYLTLFEHVAHFMDLIPGEVLLIGPLVYFYISAMVGKSVPAKRYLFLHFIPAILLWLYNAPSVFQPLENKVAIWQFVLTNSSERVLPVKFVVLFLAIKAHLSTYLFLSWRYISQFSEVCDNLRADNSEQILAQMRFMVVSLFILELVWVSLFVAQQFFAIGTLSLVSDIWLLLVAIIVLGIGYIALQKTDLVLSKEESALLDNYQSAENTEEPESNVKYIHSALTDEQADSLSQILEQQINSKQLYLDDKLTLTTLAKETGIKAHTLSQVINQSMKTNFYRLVNTYRVQHAIKLIDNTSINWSIERIAYESGFANRVTFSKAFKEIMGQTASAYKKQQKYTVNE